MSASREWPGSLRIRAGSPLVSEVSTQDELFIGLPTRDVARILAEGVGETYKRHASLFVSGTRADRLYLLRSGRVRTYVHTSHGQEVVLRIAGEGEILGWKALDHIANYTLSAAAYPECVCTAWDAKKFRQLMLSYPRFALNVSQQLAKLTFELHDRAVALITQRAEHRVIVELIRLTCRFAQPHSDGRTLVLASISESDVAGLVGTTVYTVSRTLRKLERKGMITKGRLRILVNDLPNLIRAVNYQF